MELIAHKDQDLDRMKFLAGLLYLALIILGFYMTMFVTPNIQVLGNPEATYDNLLKNDFLFRTGIFAHLLNSVVFILLVLTLYQMLKSVNQYVSKLMVAFVVVHIAFEFGAEALNLTALMIAKGKFLESLGLLQKQEWAYLFLRTARFTTMTLPMAFWGLWLISLGILVYKSGFVPKLLGVLLLLGGIAYLTESSIFILYPGIGKSFLSLFIVLYATGPISFMLWLLITGILKKK